MTGPNQDQADYWSSDAGQTWVTNEDVLDASLAPVLNHVLEVAALREGEHVLDIGCGTGASTLAAAQQVGPQGHVTGLDIAAPMLDRARGRADAAGMANVDFLVADAQTHEFSGKPYDVAISRFGVMFFQDSVAAFANLLTALKPGGRIVFMAWSTSQKNPWFGIPAQAAVAQVGAPPQSDPHAPGPMAFADRDRVRKICEDAGLDRVSVSEVTLDLTPPGRLADVARFATHLGPGSRILRLKDATEDDFAQAALQVEKGFQAYETSDGIRIPATLNLITATRP